MASEFILIQVHISLRPFYKTVCDVQAKGGRLGVCFLVAQGLNDEVSCNVAGAESFDDKRHMATIVVAES